MTTAVNPWLALPDGRPSASHTRQLRAAHERLVTARLPGDDVVRSVVRDSWRRSWAAASTPTAASRRSTCSTTTCWPTAPPTRSPR